jgi:cytochrome c
MSTRWLAHPEGFVKLLIALPVAAAVFGATALLAPPAVVAGPPQDVGAQVFGTCRACHTLNKGGKNGLGPNLGGLFGRKAGTAAGYAYSPALKASNITWNDKTLDQFLSGPTVMVKGTRMVMKVPDPAKRTALIGYLKRETSK